MAKRKSKKPRIVHAKDLTQTDMEEIVAESIDKAAAATSPQVTVTAVRNCRACGAAKHFTFLAGDIDRDLSKKACDLCGTVGQWV